MSLLQRVQDWFFPPPPPPPQHGTPEYTLGPPARSDYANVSDLLVEHDHEMRTIEEIVSTIRRTKKASKPGGLIDGTTPGSASPHR